MLSPPARIDPITVNALIPLLAPCTASRDRSSNRPGRSTRCANITAGSSPAFGTRFASVKPTDTRPRRDAARADWATSIRSAEEQVSS